MLASRIAAIFLALIWAGDGLAQEKGSLDPKPLPPLANPA
jgi:hypothetical protein